MPSPDEPGPRGSVSVPGRSNHAARPPGPGRVLPVSAAGRWARLGLLDRLLNRADALIADYDATGARLKLCRLAPPRPEPAEPGIAAGSPPDDCDHRATTMTVHILDYPCPRSGV